MQARVDIKRGGFRLTNARDHVPLEVANEQARRGDLAKCITIRIDEKQIVVPGHDVPMVLENGAIKYIGEREAAISAWYGDDMETTTLFKLTL